MYKHRNCTSSSSSSSSSTPSATIAVVITRLPFGLEGHCCHYHRLFSWLVHSLVRAAPDAIEAHIWTVSNLLKRLKGRRFIVLSLSYFPLHLGPLSSNMPFEPRVNHLLIRYPLRYWRFISWFLLISFSLSHVQGVADVCTSDLLPLYRLITYCLCLCNSYLSKTQKVDNRIVDVVLALHFCLVGKGIHLYFLVVNFINMYE